MKWYPKSGIHLELEIDFRAIFWTRRQHTKVILYFDIAVLINYLILHLKYVLLDSSKYIHAVRRKCALYYAA